MSAAMTELMASQLLAKELWISFASLLRSHVSMHSVARPDCELRVLLNTGSVVEVLGPNGKMTIVAPTASNKGAIEFRPKAGEQVDEYSAFFFTEDGLLNVEDVNDSMDIEAAVDYLLNRVRA